MEGLMSVDDLKKTIEIRVCDSEPARLIFYDTTWYFIPEWTENHVAFCKSHGLITKYMKLFGVYWWTTETGYEKGDLSKRKSSKYPELFENFWKSYHKERRIGKKGSYNEWLKLSQSDRDILPGAALKYTADIEANSLPKYMKHPERFIKSRMFEDYAEMESNAQDILKARQFYEHQFMAKQKHPYAFNQKEMERLSTDVSKYGLRRTCELVWIFMNDYDKAVKDAVREINRGYMYNVFSSLLNSTLGGTKKEVPPKCSFCGKRIGHDKNCPELIKKSIDKIKEQKEIEEARNMSVDLSGMFKDKIKHGK